MNVYKCNENSEKSQFAEGIEEIKRFKGLLVPKFKIRGPRVRFAHYANFIHTTSDRKPFLRGLAALGGAAKDNFVVHCVLVHYMQS